eukprot:g2605.t1
MSTVAGQVDAATQKSAWLIVEGQEEGSHQANSMGFFKLVEGKVANARAVWQMADEDGAERYMYLGTDDRWYINGSKGAMEAGRAGGDVAVAAAGAFTPDQVKGVWTVWDGSRFVPAPDVRVQAQTGAEWKKRAKAAKQQREKKRKEAVQAAKKVERLWMSGPLTQGGRYERMPGREVNGRGAWELKGLTQRSAFDGRPMCLRTPRQGSTQLYEPTK